MIAVRPLIGRRRFSPLLLLIPLALLAACSARVPEEIARNNDLDMLAQQVELPFRPSRGTWEIHRHASSGRDSFMWAHLIAVIEIPEAVRPAVLTRLRATPTSASRMLDMELGPMTGPLFEPAKRRASQVHVAVPFVRGKKFPTADISELIVFDDGIVVFLLSSPTKTTRF